ncbi:MAG TPA: amino acid adenylation domain-containing protein [Myxococcaceae bacterium]|jgi:amino acid adenylation domain-containing protein
MDEVRNRIARLTAEQRATLAERLAAARREGAAAGEPAQKLFAFVVPVGGEATSASELRDFASEHLPPHLVPGEILLLESLPLTATGKVDRQALIAARAGSAADATRFVAPRTGFEELLAGIWCELLNLPRVSADANFFDVGGHSLLAARVASRAQQVLERPVPVRALFEHPTLSRLAAHLQAADGVAGSAHIAARADPSEWPLSFSQQRLWFLDQLQPGSAVYNVPCAVRLRGELDVPAMAAALNRVVARHEPLRASFPGVDGRPAQAVRPTLTLELPVADAGAGESLEALCDHLCAAEARRPFDLERGPLIRAALFRLAPSEHLLLVSMHHIVSDGWSLSILVGEVAAAYRSLRAGSEPSLPPLPIQYADFAAWQRQRLRAERMEELTAYWRRHLEGAPEALALPADHPRPAVQSYRGGRLFISVPHALVARVEELGRRAGTTLFMTLLSAFGVLLGRYSGQRDVVIGTSVAGRSKPELEGLIGFFVNTLALRVDLSRDPPFRELLGRVREVCLGAYAHEEMPFDRLVAGLRPERDLSRSPLFQAAFELHNEPDPALSLEELVLEPLHPDTGASQYDLALELTRSPSGLTGLFEYSADLFEHETVARMARHFARLLESLVDAPSAPISRASLLPPEERRELLQVHALGPEAAGARVSAWWAGRSSFADLFEARVDEQPGEIAAVEDGRALTYAELNSRANRVAHALMDRGAGTDRTVGLLLDRGIDFLAGILGAFKAGAAYVPLDPALPSPRLESMVAQAGCVAVLTEAKHAGLARALGPATLPVLDVAALAAGGEARNPERSGSERDLAYVFFTSGSTGTPKGAMVEQRGMLNHLGAKVHDLQLGPGDAIIQNASQSFDISVWQFLVALGIGGRVRIVSDEVARDPFRLLELVAAERVTVLEIVPSLMRSLLEGIRGAPPRLEHLRWLVVTGEALPPELCRAWLELYPGIPVVNAYGPTECSDDVTHHVLREAPPARAMRVPIGRPLPNLRVHVLDGRLEPVPVGVLGEVYVGGVAVGRGYLKDPGGTAKSFLPDPHASTPGARLYRTGDIGRLLPDGSIEFHGRRDHQVKIRGYRIETGEIEAALSALEGVRQALVQLRTPASGKRLVAYVAATPGAALQPQDLLRALRRTLPEYMVPSAVVVLDELPLLPSGKVDLRALPDPAELPGQEDGYQAPRTPTEEMLSALWAELLELPRVGRADNFFERGGHSLIAIQIVSRVRRAFGVELPVRALFEEPTVEGIARRVEVLRADPGAGKAGPVLHLFGVPMTRLEDQPAYELSPYQLPELYMKQLEPDNPYYNVSNSDILLEGDLDLDAFVQAWQAMVERHPAFRTTFELVGGKPVARIHPPPQLRLADLYLDRRDTKEADFHAEVSALAQRFGTTSFDFEEGPIHALRLAEFPNKRFLLLFVTHHILWDERCTIVLAEELTELYNSIHQRRAPKLPEIPFRYVDFSHAINRALAEGRLEAQRRYWLQKLAPLPPVMALPTDFERPPVQTYNGATVEGVLPIPALRRLEAFLRQRQLTLYMFLLAVLDMQLYRLTGQADFVVGTPIANRNDEALERVIGCFATAMPMRCTVSPEMTFEQLLAQVRSSSVEAYENHAFPSILAIQELNPSFDPSRNRLFSLMYGLQNNKTRLMEHLKFDGVKLDFLRGLPTPEFDRAKFDITLVVDQFGDEVVMQWNYNTDLFLRETVQRMLDQQLSLIEQVLDQPSLPLTAYRMLGDRERARLLQELNDTAVPFDLGESIAGAFEAQVARTPDAGALVFDGGTLSYRALDQAANRWARQLMARGAGLGSRVGVLMERSPAQVVALLAALKAGAAYVPVSPDLPEARQRAILTAAKVEVLMVDARSGLRWEGHTLPVEGLPTSGDDAPPRVPLQGGDLAYVLFTSGTTGEPKGIEIEHRGVLNVVASTQRLYGLTARDAPCFASSFAFDASILDLFWPLLVGARVAVPRPDDARDPERLAAAIDRLQATVVQCVPLMLASLAEARRAGRIGALPSLRQVICGGAALTREVFEQFRAAFPATPLANHYGPTEVTVDAARFDCAEPFAGQGVPIGRPISNARIYVLDPRMEPVPTGVIGELYVASPGLARGYLGTPDLTARRFVPDPFSTAPGARLYRSGDLGRYDPKGNLHFVGRVDKQVKIRGNRVEIEEIESRLAQHQGVSRCLVRHVASKGGDALVAHVELGAQAVGVEVRGRKLRLFTLAQRPDLKWAAEALHAGAWPAYFAAAPVMRSHWARASDEFAHLQLLVTDETDRLLAVGNAAAIRWDGTPADLPPGWDAALVRALDESEKGVAPDTLLMLAAVVATCEQGAGLSQGLLELFKRLGRALGLARAIVPVRPTGKVAHPELTFQEWCARRRADGLPEDDWLRVHERIGGRILALAPSSQRVESCLEDWEQWAGRRFEASGEYAVREALQPVRIDLENRRGVYEDPAVWMEHPQTEPHDGWAPVDAAALRDHLRGHLPEYMVPDHFHFVARMPLNESGKIDERALPPGIPGRGHHARYVAPQTPVQHRLAEIWKEVLGLEKVGIHDDFFEAGGHSIRAMQMLALIQQALGVKLALRQLFTERTIRGLAATIEALGRERDVREH